MDLAITKRVLAALFITTAGHSPASAEFLPFYGPDMPYIDASHYRIEQAELLFSLSQQVTTTITITEPIIDVYFLQAYTDIKSDVVLPDGRSVITGIPHDFTTAFLFHRIDYSTAVVGNVGDVISYTEDYSPTFPYSLGDAFFDPSLYTLFSSNIRPTLSILSTTETFDTGGVFQYSLDRGPVRFTPLGYIVEVMSVPEPATWAMMVAGFGMIGVACRHRRTRVSFV